MKYLAITFALMISVNSWSANVNNRPEVDTSVLEVEDIELLREVTKSAADRFGLNYRFNSSRVDSSGRPEVDLSVLDPEDIELLNEIMEKYRY